MSENERQESTREWVSSGALRVVTGLLLALFGWVLADRLGDVRTQLETLNTTTRQLLVEQRGQDARLTAVEHDMGSLDRRVGVIEDARQAFWRDYGPFLRRQH